MSISTVGRHCERNVAICRDSESSEQIASHPFTLMEVQRIYETILGKKLDKRNFRKKTLAMDTVQELEGQTKMEGFHRPAQLYAVKG